MVDKKYDTFCFDDYGLWPQKNTLLQSWCSACPEPRLAGVREAHSQAFTQASLLLTEFDESAAMSEVS